MTVAERIEKSVLKIATSRQYYYCLFLFILIGVIVHLTSEATTEGIVASSLNNDCVREKVLNYPKVIHNLTMIQIENQCGSDEEIQQQKNNIMQLLDRQKINK